MKQMIMKWWNAEAWVPFNEDDEKCTHGELMLSGLGFLAVVAACVMAEAIAC